jgi:hypothetical protein
MPIELVKLPDGNGAEPAVATAVVLAGGGAVAAVGAVGAGVGVVGVAAA